MDTGLDTEVVERHRLRDVIGVDRFFAGLNAEDQAIVAKIARTLSPYDWTDFSTEQSLGARQYLEQRARLGKEHALRTARNVFDAIRDDLRREQI